MAITHFLFTRRGLLTAAGTALAIGATGLKAPARTAGPAPTTSMRGRGDQLSTGAPVVERVRHDGFWMRGTVRRTGDRAPLPRQRIQICAHTTEGPERDPHSHGTTRTGEKDQFCLELPQIVPDFGQPHGHLAYDNDAFKTVFLRLDMAHASDTTLSAHFILQPA